MLTKVADGIEVAHEYDATGVLVCTLWLAPYKKGGPIGKVGVQLSMDDRQALIRALSKSVCPNCGEERSLERGCEGMPDPVCPRRTP